MTGHTLLVEFANDARDFALGFECGRVWAILLENDDEFDCEMHGDNAEMVLRMAQATDRTADAEIHDDVWLTVRFSERGAA